MKKIAAILAILVALAFGTGAAQAFDPERCSPRWAERYAEYCNVE